MSDYRLLNENLALRRRVSELESALTSAYLELGALCQGSANEQTEVEEKAASIRQKIEVRVTRLTPAAPADQAEEESWEASESLFRTRAKNSVTEAHRVQAGLPFAPYAEGRRVYRTRAQIAADEAADQAPETPVPETFQTESERRAEEARERKVPRY